MTTDFKALQVPHRFSLMSYLLKAHTCDENGRPCTNCGTCFFIRVDTASIVMVTNWQLLTGCDPVTENSSSGWIGSPHAIDVTVIHLVGEEVRFADISIALYDGNQPSWFEHKNRRLPGYDLAFIKLEKRPDFRSLSLDYLEIEQDEKIVPGNDCFVLGFPFGDSLGYPMCIWKRATIASESLFDFKGEPRFLVDTATRPGMSGSPVFKAKRGVKLRTPLQAASAATALEQLLDIEILPSHDPQGELIMEFCGVYQGVFTDRIERDFQLGYVIEAKALTELIRDPQPGTIKKLS